MHSRVHGHLAPEPNLDMAYPNFFALIGDIVGSRQLDDRADVQVRFRDGIRALNVTHGALLTAPLKLTAGDEVQGLTRHPHVVVDIISGLAETMFPVEVAWGLGRGDVTTDLVDDVSLLDGSSFHRAREAVEVSKRKSKWFEVRGVSEPSGATLAALFNLIGALRSSWTSRQAEVVREARGKTQAHVAEDLDVAESTISRTLGAAHYKRIVEGEEAARSLLAYLEQVSE